MTNRVVPCQKVLNGCYYENVELRERIRVLEAFVVAYDDQQDWWREGPETTNGEDGPDSWTDASVQREIDTHTAVERTRAAVGELETVEQQWQLARRQYLDLTRAQAQQIIELHERIELLEKYVSAAETVIWFEGSGLSHSDAYERYIPHRKEVLKVPPFTQNNYR